MGMKMKFPFLFKNPEANTDASASAWAWVACADSPKTLSFRASNNTKNIYRTMNSTFLDNNITTEFAETQQICDSNPQNDNDELAVEGGLRSDRLFFEPGGTNSILDEAKTNAMLPYEDRDVTVMAMDSMNPFHDFRVSMEEMVEAHGLKDWECLEELLSCYLRVNGKSNHGYIVGAFVDILIHLALADTVSVSNSVSTSTIDENCSSSSTTTQGSFTSPLSFYSSTCSSTSPCLSSFEHEETSVVEKNECHSSSSMNKNENRGRDVYLAGTVED